MAIEGESNPVLREAMRVNAESLWRARTIAADEQRIIDTTLMWMAGLMGAGVLGLPTALGPCRLSGRSLFQVALPWVLGLLVAVGARVVAMGKRTADGRLFVAKWDALQTGALDPTADMSALRSRLQSAVSGVGEPRLMQMQTFAAALNRLLTWLFYAVHGFFVLGVLLVLSRLWKC